MSFVFREILIGNAKSSVSVANCVVDAGDGFTLDLKSTGELFAWGADNRGQLGDGSTGYTRCAAVPIYGSKKTFSKISAGTIHSVAIDKNGKAWGWGANFYGETGNTNTGIDISSPVSVAGTTKTFCKISAGNFYSVAIDNNGRAWGWGYNAQGQLGDNTVLSKCTPVSVAGTTKTFCEISAGYVHTTAIDKNGKAWAWGDNSSGKLGDNTILSKCTPVSVAGTTKTFCQISAGYDHTTAIDKNGKAWAWGENSNGQLGNNNYVPKCTPVSVAGTTKTFCKISGGYFYSVAIDKNGKAWAWGYNSYGQLGNGTTTYKCTPVSVAGTTKTFCQISTGGSHTVAIDNNGRTWTWGYNYYGQLGINIIADKCTPVSVAGTVKTFCQISAGNTATYSIDKNGLVWSWGDNTYGQLGNGLSVSQNKFTQSPTSISGVRKTFCKISGGYEYSVAIDKNGGAWGWGYGGNFQLGIGSSAGTCTPVSVAGTTKTFCEISAGYVHTTAIDKNGKAWAWGTNTTGQLGDNTTLTKCTPVSVAGTTKTFCKISSGGSHTVAIDKNGKAWAWGNNANGQLGDNTALDKCTPVSVAGTTKTFCKISTGNAFSLGIDKNGRAWGWGVNSFSQLGNNSSSDTCTPVSVAGAVKTFCQISAGLLHSVAIDKNGKAWGWGYDGFGQLGDNNIAGRVTPVSVAGTTKTFCQITAGYQHTIAIDKNGIAWAWGYNNSGQLGDNTVYRNTPVRICNI